MRDQVEEIKAKIDIADIVGEYVNLKKAGTNFKGLCPFHNEKSPSFMVNPEIQIFKCFGCGESGDVFSFLEKQEGMSFYEALQFLAQKAGVVLKSSSDTKETIGLRQKERGYEVLKQVHKFYQYMLHTHEMGKPALQYLTTVRGLTLETIQAFEIGFAPNDFHVLENVFVRKKRASAKELEDVGLIYMRDGRANDRFRGRVMFPLYNHRGDLQGFAGRILPQFDTKTSGKYINSPETSLYHKGSNLFGLWFTRKEIKQKGYAVLVEGPLDAIASYQGGVKNVAAIQGTSLTEEQVKLLGRFTKKLVFSLDSDFAGDNAERKGIRLAENEGMEIRVARLTGYKDPGEAAIQDPKLYQSVVREAVGVWDFIIDSVFKKYKTIDGEDKAKISRELVPLLSEIEDTIVRNHYIVLTAKKLGVSPESVSSEVGKHGFKTYTPQNEVSFTKQLFSRKDMLEERFLSLAFMYNASYLRSREHITSFIDNPILKKLLAKYRDFHPNDDESDISSFAKTLEGEEKKALENLLLKSWDDIDKDSQAEYNTELDRLSRELELLFVRSQLDTIADEVKSLKGNARKEKLLQASQKYQYLQKLQSQLEAKQ